MAQSRQNRRVSPADVAVDAIPMKGIKPIWYAVGAGGVFLVLAIVVGTSIAGKRKGAEVDSVPLNAVVPAVDTREQAAERRHHLEITQRSLERLKEAEDQKKTEAKAGESTPSASTTPAAVPAAPAAAAVPVAPAAAAVPVAPAAAPAQPKAQKKQLDTLDNIGSDITKQLGQ
jgi:hypothetical protein